MFCQNYYRFVFVSEKQTIDFEELTYAGLFGFWSSWFWKSSVLKPLVLFIDRAFEQETNVRIIC
jgi:hypothetical protein